MKFHPINFTEGKYPSPSIDISAAHKADVEEVRLKHNSFVEVEELEEITA
jgi:hypothetical protein